MATKKQKQTTEPVTLVTFLLDRSYSMGVCRDATIEAFNSYIAELRDAKTPMLFTFLQFDYYGSGCSIEKVCFEQAPKSVADLTTATYQPRGGTPLVEAATKTIQALDTAVKAKADKPKVVVCIQTDGEENQSGREYSWASLKALIEAKTKEGWQFNFMGAGIDAYDQGQKMGIAAMATMSYDLHDKVATRAAFRASASNTRLFGSGAAATTEYSMAQRSASGDRFAHRAQATPSSLSSVKTSITGSTLDLGGGTTAKRVDVIDLTQ